MVTLKAYKLNIDEFRKISQHTFCLIEIDTYVDPDGVESVCVECTTCNKIIVKFRRINGHGAKRHRCRASGESRGII